VALLTGAVRRNGRAMALALARNGASVAINARSSKDEADAVCAELDAIGHGAMVHMADITDEAAVRDMIDAVVARFGRLDILVNNAANRKQTPFLEIDFQEWQAFLAPVLNGAFLCSRAALPHLVASGAGTIVNMGGISAHAGAMNRAHVCTAKGGLVGLTKALAVEFADKNVTVNCVAPGMIGGERPASAGEMPPPVGGRGPLLGREGTFEEIAACVLMLCLPNGRYMTGQTLHVNGGMYFP
jgi:3-oxoacyl-[acyl-carrier protein] reductase